MDLYSDFASVPPGSDFVIMQPSAYEPHQFVVLEDGETRRDVAEKFTASTKGKATKAETDVYDE